MAVKSYDVKEYITRAQNGDEEAKETLVKDNLGLVWSIVHRLKSKHYDNEDLFQIGCIGIIKAINNFDHSYNVQFSTYAVPIIMGEIKRHFRDDGTIKVSRSLKELNIRVQKTRDQLAIEYQREPTIDEIAEFLDVDRQEIVVAYDASFYPTSLSEPIYEKDGSTINVEDRIPDPKNKLWFEKIALQEEIKKLNSKEQLIIQLRYYADMNQEDIAKRLGISQVQVSRLEKKIIEKLKSQLL